MKGEKKSQNDPKKKKKQSKENKTRLPFGLDESLEPATPPGGRAFLATERRTKRGKKKKREGGEFVVFSDSRHSVVRRRRPLSLLCRGTLPRIIQAVRATLPRLCSSANQRILVSLEDEREKKSWESKKLSAGKRSNRGQENKGKGGWGARQS